MCIAKRLGVALVSFTLAQPAIATESTVPTEPTIAPANEAIVTTADEDGMVSTRLSLRDAVNLALENNLGVEIQRHAPLIADEDLSVAWGAYDPTLTGNVTYLGDRPPSGVSGFNAEGREVETTTGGASLSGLVPLVGATLTLDYDATRIEGQPTSNLSPQYESGLAVSATIPLLKGLVWNDPWTQVKLASVGRSASREEFRGVLMDTVNDAISAYWNLVATREQLRVAEKSLETGTALLDQTSTQYEVGVKSRVEVVQAEAGVAARELDVIRADAAYHNAQDILLDAIYGTRLTATSTVLLEPTDSPFDFTEYEVNRTVAADHAMRHRPERAALMLEIENQETRVRFRKNQRLPQLDLNLSYGTSGIEGPGNPDALFGPRDDPDTPEDERELALPAFLEGTGGNFDDTPDAWFKRRGAREYAVGGVISIPLGNYGPRHSVSKARLELRQAQTRLKQLDQQIILEVRQGIRALEAARKGIDASERQRIAAEEQLRAERIRLEHGESTPFDVLQKESDLVEAESAKIEALQLYRTSASQLDRAQGTILRNHNVVVGSLSELKNGLEPESFAPRDLVDPILP